MRLSRSLGVAAFVLGVSSVLVLPGCAAESGEETADQSSAVGESGSANAGAAVIDTGAGCAHQYADWFNGTATVQRACENRKPVAKYYVDELFQWPSGNLAKSVPESSIWHESSPASRAALLGVVMDRAERGDPEAESLLKLFFGDFKKFIAEGWKQGKGDAYNAARNVILSAMREQMKLGAQNDRYRDLTLADLPLGSLFDVFGGAPPGIDLRKVAEELFGSQASSWPDAKLADEIRKLGVPVAGGSVVGKTLDQLSAQARSLLDPNVWLRKGYDFVLNKISDYIASKLHVNELVDVIVGSAVHTIVKEAGAYVLGTMKAGTTAFSSAFFSALYANVFFAVAVHFVVEPVLGAIVDLVSFLLAGDLEERTCTNEEAVAVRSWFQGNGPVLKEKDKLKNLTTVARYTCMNATSQAASNRAESASVRVSRVACLAKENARQSLYGAEFEVECETCYRYEPRTCRTFESPLPSEDMREARKVPPGDIAAYSKMLREKYLASHALEGEAVAETRPLVKDYDGRLVFDRLQVRVCQKLDPQTTCSDLVMAKEAAYAAMCRKNPLDPSCTGCGRLKAPQKQLADWEVWTRSPRVMSERAFALNAQGAGDVRAQAAGRCAAPGLTQYNPIMQQTFCCPVDLGESRVLTPAERNVKCGGITNATICNKNDKCAFRGGKCVDKNSVDSGASSSASGTPSSL